MISSAEFQQKLRSGQIYDALALVVQETIELEITTRMTEDPECDPAANGEYLRTKINLLTGNIHNEVGQNVVANPNFPKLQQLHLDQLVASQQGVQSYLEQIQAILAILPPHSMANGDRRYTSVETSGQVAAPLAASSDPTPDLDEDLDLSIDRDGEVWEEWVEDEDFISRSEILSPPLMAPRLPHPAAPAQWVGRLLDPIALKPIVPRAATTPVDPATKWEQFEPEHLGCEREPQPRVNHYPDPQQMDKILADLDI
jgi:hypothetical protein